MGTEVLTEVVPGKESLGIELDYTLSNPEKISMTIILEKVG